MLVADTRASGRRRKPQISEEGASLHSPFLHVGLPARRERRHVTRREVRVRLWLLLLSVRKQARCPRAVKVFAVGAGDVGRHAWRQGAGCGQQQSGREQASTRPWERHGGRGTGALGAANHGIQGMCREELES